MAKKEFIQAAYFTCKKFYEQQISLQEGIKSLAGIGMNAGSAFINLNVFKHLMAGENFTRTLTGVTFDFFFKKIYTDYGKEQLSVSLKALSQHIDYMETKRNYRMRLVRNIKEKYALLLKEAIDEEIDEDEDSFPEGKEKYRLHRFKERNRKLIALAKQRLRLKDPEMKCEICKFSFVHQYGKIGLDFIEAHHVFPISALTKETPMRVEDLAMVCSNCHRMIHRKRPWLNIEDIKNLLQ